MALSDDDTTARYTCTLCGFDSGWLPVSAITAARTRHMQSHMAAPRPAGTETSGRAVGAADTLRALGLAVHVGTLVPSGAAVRLDIDDTARWLEPEEARTLAVALEQAAMDAVHEDRAARRG